MTLLQKIDSLTPWHVLRDYATTQEAVWAAIQFAKQRPAEAKYPQYSVNGRTY